MAHRRILCELRQHIPVARSNGNSGSNLEYRFAPKSGATFDYALACQSCARRPDT